MDVVTVESYANHTELATLRALTAPHIKQLPEKKVAEPVKPPTEIAIAELERAIPFAIEKDPEWFNDRDNRRNTVWGIKRGGYGERGFEAAKLFCSLKRNTKRYDRLDRYWFDEGADEGTITLRSFWDHVNKLGFKQTAEELGEWKRAEMSKAIAPHIAGVQGMQSTAPVPMAGGRGEKHVELFGPILATVPHVERTAEHPEMPDTGHPLRDAINAAIPGIMSTGNTEALAVIEVVHCHTAPLVGTITNEIKARAVALQQDAENRSLTMGTYHCNLKNNEPERDNVDNMKFFLRSLNIEIRFNEWIEREEIRGWVWKDWQPLDDTAVARLRMRGSETGTRFLPSKEFIWDALLSMAHANRVDPARDLLDLLQSEWDGEPRLATWLTKACGVPDDAYHRAVGESMLRGLCARIRQPGCKYDLMTVFISERQGTSKSTLAKVLALNSDWFAEDVSLGEASKELVLLLAGKAVAEISEMKTRGQVEDLKRMLSRTHDEARTAYSRKPTKRARRNIFIGSTNDPEFLEDVTGGRRFLPITVRGEIDLDFVRSNLAQLVGEAATQQAQGVDINLPRDVWEIAGQHQEAARITTGTEELLRDWYETPETDVFVRSAEIVKRLADERQIGTNMKAIAPIMRRIGYERDRTNAERLWVKSATGKYHAGCRHVGRVPQIMGPPPAVPAPRQPSQPIEHVTQPPKAIPAPPF